MKEKLDLTKIATRSSMTPLRENSMAAAERRQLRWALCESMKFQKESAGSSAEQSVSPVVRSKASELSSLSVRGITVKKCFSASESTSDSEATQSDTEATLSDTEATLSDTEATQSDTEATQSDTEATLSDTETTQSYTEATQSDTEATLSDTEATQSYSEVMPLTTSVSEEKIPDSLFPFPSSSHSNHATGTSSILDVIDDPEQNEIELTYSPERMETDASTSDASPRGFESDFHLVMTESESESDERRSQLKLRKRQKIDDDDDSNVKITVPRTSVTLKLSPFHSEAEEERFSIRSEAKGRQPLFHSETENRRSPLHSVVESRQFSISSKTTSEEMPSEADHGAPHSLPVLRHSHIETENDHSTQEMEARTPPPKRVIQPLQCAPTAARLRQTAGSYGLPATLHTTPFYSNPDDVQPPQ